MKVKGLREFIKKLEEAEKNLSDEMQLWLDASGMEFLDIIQDEIIRTETVDTRRLLNSFDKGDSENVWNISKGGLSLEIGTNVDYASYVNDGHNTVSLSSGKDRRWVPGYWQGDRFVYDPGADTGMLLKQQWVDGSYYWDNALAIFEKMFSKSMERQLEKWLGQF
ncbi:HK97 gp10 family phage protein [Jeotgalibacillus malaysiensis]|uniref:HK97 gp10 family phage protein n=1 Tax=Jeotgalibacillus malaysiensis TaxID=1508404 RepID=UPI00384B1750